MTDAEAIAGRIAFLAMTSEEKWRHCVFCGEEFVAPVCGHINCGGRFLDVKIPSLREVGQGMEEKA